MLEKENIVDNGIEKTSLSLPTEFFNQIKAIANENGISQNATMMMLMRFGLKVYNAPF